MLKFLLPLLLIFISNTTLAKKPTCDFEMSQLKRIQEKMKKGGYGERTRDKERELHKKYQDCRINKNKYTENIEIKNQNKIEYTQKQKLYKSEKNSVYRSSKYKKGKATANVKGRYQGLKQDGWIKYYKTPKHCFRPKNTSVFAKCLNHRDTEAKKFDVIWAKKNAPQTFKLG
ncbi:hypothetical protein [Colwellia sp. Bg11-12]|uniref:hypothetical protein n=1 Tax=Colwellia sp. Bg11-12 TaxID=2759817 RepID=UPI0015F3FF44|nr:hypothetical protein [Colwellia sp. Bg11-12]MBA6262152.1 hypothetical protein [Colwellia sp. Bg11-12]